MPDGSEDVIYCQNCGQQLLATANFCDRCGQDVDGDRTESTSENTAPSAESADEDSGGISRRRAIGYGAGGVVVGFAGLSFFLGATSPTHENVGEEGWSGSTSTGSTSQTLSGTATLESGGYMARSLSPPVPVNAEIDVDVRSGGPIDVFLMERSELNTYTEGSEEFLYFDSLSETEVSATTLTDSLSSGDYAFVLDNTGVFGASPDGEAVVDVEATLSV